MHVILTIEKDTTEIVYDNKNLHITELEDTLPVFILFISNKR
jgi:predicted transglutaminase-like cysteine proteinase